MQKFVRRIDDLGRVVIPKEVRTALHINEGDPLDMKVVQAGILISPLNAACGICGSTKDLLQVDGISICTCCAMRLWEILAEKRKEAKTK